MADFNPVQRPVPHEDDSHKKDKKTVGTPEKFKDSFRVQEVKPTNEEEKKKRKRPEETQMETQAEGLVAPQAQLQSNLSPSPYSVQPPVKKVGATQATASPAPQSAPLGSSYTPTAPSVGAPTPMPIPTSTTTTQAQPTSATPPPPAATPTASPAPYVAQPAPPQEPSYEEAEPLGQDYFQPTAMPTAPQQATSSSQPSSAETDQTDQTQETDDTQDTQKTTNTNQPSDKESSDKTQLKKGVPGSTSKMIGTGEDLSKIPGEEQLLKGNEPILTDKTKTQVLDKKLSPGDAQRTTSTIATESTDTVISSGPKQTTDKTSFVKTSSDTSSLQKGTQDTKAQQLPQQQAAGNAVTDAKPMQVAPPPPPSLRQKDVTVEEAGLSWEGDVQPSSALSSDSSNKDKNDKNDSNKDDQNPESQSQLTAMQTPVPFAIDTPNAQAAVPTYTTFSPAVLEMFDKMVGTISVLQETSGERKTTVSLTSPNFSSSVFFGSEIVIEEDTHLAPGQYNIKLIGSPEAVNLFQAKRNDLMAAFQEGNYNFRVQRLETSIQGSDRPLFKRKEAAGEDTSKDTGQGE